MSFYILNLPIPIVSQHNPQSSDVENNLCGETCCCAIIGYIYGTDSMPTPTQVSNYLQTTSATNENQLSGYLQNGWGINSTKLAPTSQDQFNWQVWNYLVNGKVVMIVQLYSYSIKTAHWRLVIGMDNNNYWLMDPWNGTVIKQTYSDFWNLYNSAGSNKQLLGIDTP